MVLVSLMLAFAIIGALWFFAATLTNVWEWNWLMTTILFPLALWLLTAYVAVYRFLSYLDLRIRLEGWEVELKIRAEANRLAERMQIAS